VSMLTQELLNIFENWTVTTSKVDWDITFF
jgi:hypothetical protein